MRRAETGRSCMRVTLVDLSDVFVDIALGGRFTIASNVEENFFERLPAITVN